MTLAARLHLLFVCGRNKRRSPTAERVFGRQPGLDVRARGLSAKAPRTLSAADLEWADLVFVMERAHAARLRANHRAVLGETPLRVLDIPDDFEFMDPELIEILESRVRGQLERP